MLEEKHLQRLKKIAATGSRRLDLTKNLLCAIALGEKLSYKFRNSKEAAQTFSGLRRYKFVRHIKEKGDNYYALTKKGEKRLLNIVIDDIELKSKKHWDGKWHLVMYDLPVRFKRARDAFRWKLKDLGFYQFQKSVWIYPYSCEEEILFVADFFGVRKHIEILEVNKILDDRKLKAHFGL
jgi:hypothetical protein